MTRKEAIDTLKVIKAMLKIYPKRKKQKESVAQLDEALNLAIHALRQPPNEDWERYSDLLWKEAYERGKQDALKVCDRYD